MDKIKKSISRTGSLLTSKGAPGRSIADIETGDDGKPAGPNSDEPMETNRSLLPSQLVSEKQEDLGGDPGPSNLFSPEQTKADTRASGPAQTKANELLGTGLQQGGVPGINSEKTKIDNDGASGSNETDGWRTLFNNYKKLDDYWVQNINDDIGTLLLFAGLFSTVLTAFLVEVYADLQPDNTQLSAPVLIDISKQLHAMSLGQVAPATTVSSTTSNPSPLRVATTALWLLSLILSLGAALFGILVKQWVREYMRWTSIYPFQHALHIRYHRRKSLDRWRVEGAVVVVWMCLVLGLILFFFGPAVLSFDVNLAIAVVATTMIAAVFTAVSITTFLSVANPSCPYRTPLSTSFLITLTYALTKLAPTLDVIVNRWKRISWPKILKGFKKVRENAEQSENKHPGKELGPWRRLVSNTRKLWALEDRDKHFWVEDVWSGWDKVLHLSNDVGQCVLVSWKIISWLIGHQPVSADLITQCFSDFPGSPPPNVGTDEAWLEANHWRAREKSEKSRRQFSYLCRALVDSMGLSTTVEDFTQFLNDYVWKIQVSSSVGSSKHLMPFHIDVSLALLLRRAIQNIDPPTRNGLLKCISWLTKNILDERQFSLKQQDFGLFASLLGIYFMLVDNRYPEPGKTDLYDVYHRTLANIISAEKPVRQRLDSNNVPDPSRPMDVRSRIEFAGNLLSFSCSGSRFDGTKSWRLEAKTIIQYMSAAVQFADRWDLKTLEQLSLEDATTTEDVNRGGSISTKVFWALATIVFDSGNTRTDELNKLTDYRSKIPSFLRAVQRVLQVEVDGGNGKCWEDEDNVDRSEMTSFLILHHKHIPPKLLPVLKDAFNERIDLDKMLGHSVVVSPTSNEWIRTKFEYLGLLEELYDNNCTENTSINTAK